MTIPILVLVQVTVVLGSQWGDEGKGKLVDILAKQYNLVARAQVRSDLLSVLCYVPIGRSACISFRAGRTLATPSMTTLATSMPFTWFPPVS